MNKLAIFVLTLFIINVFGVSHLIKLFISFNVSVNEMHKHNEIHTTKLKSLKQKEIQLTIFYFCLYSLSQVFDDINDN